jgi:hypothetical protein
MSLLWGNLDYLIPFISIIVSTTGKLVECWVKLMNVPHASYVDPLRVRHPAILDHFIKFGGWHPDVISGLGPIHSTERYGSRRSSKDFWDAVVSALFFVVAGCLVGCEPPAACLNKPANTLPTAVLFKRLGFCLPSEMYFDLKFSWWISDTRAIRELLQKKLNLRIQFWCGLPFDQTICTERIIV